MRPKPMKKQEFEKLRNLDKLTPFASFGMPQIRLEQAFNFTKAVVNQLDEKGLKTMAVLNTINHSVRDNAIKTRKVFRGFIETKNKQDCIQFIFLETVINSDLDLIQYSVFYVNNTSEYIGMGGLAYKITGRFTSEKYVNHFLGNNPLHGVIYEDDNGIIYTALSSDKGV